MEEKTEAMCSMQISKDDLKCRAKDNTRASYTFSYGIMKGTSLAYAAYTLSLILMANDNNILLLLFWLASFSSFLVTHLTTQSGTLLVTYRMNFDDLVLPMIMAVVEFLSFAVLTPGALEVAPMAWLLVMSMMCFTASFLVHNRIQLLKTQDFENDPKVNIWDRVIKPHLKRIKANRRDSALSGAILLMIFFVCCWLVPQTVSDKLAFPIIAIVYIVGMGGVIHQTMSEFKQTVAEIKKL